MLTRRELALSVLPLLLVDPIRSFAQPKPFAPQLSIMLWTLKKYGTLEQNLELVAKAGYRNVELTGEFKTWSDADYTRILARMAALNLRIDATSGMKIGYVDPAQSDAFLAELKAFIPVIKRLGSPKLIVLSGKTLPNAAPGAQRQTAVDNLRRAAAVLADENLTLLLEPIDHLENPTIYLDGVTEAFEIVRELGAPNVRVLYDLYHEQRSHGNLLEKLEKNIDLVDLIHIADVPGRHEPGTGEIDYPVIYRKLRDLNYNRMIAMEFYPTADPVESLRKAREQLLSA